MNQKVNRDRSKRRGLYSLETDDAIFYCLGKFSFLTAEEIATLTGRNVVSLRKRLRQLCAAGYLAHDEGVTERQEFFEEIKCKHCHKTNLIPRSDGRIKPKPYFWWITEKGEPMAAALLSHPIAWRSKQPSRIPHDRVLTTIHLAEDRAYGDDLEWLQQKDDVKTTITMPDPEHEGREITINFYPDAILILHGEEIPLEYAHTEPSSKDGVNDIVEKVIRYNEIMKEQKDGKVIFVFREQSMVLNFLNRIADDFPYNWVCVTDLESIKHSPSGEIFWRPTDFDEGRHALVEEEKVAH
jgi:hypothetical protein